MRFIFHFFFFKIGARDDGSVYDHDDDDDDDDFCFVCDTQYQTISAERYIVTELSSKLMYCLFRF